MKIYIRTNIKEIVKHALINMSVVTVIAVCLSFLEACVSTSAANTPVDTDYREESAPFPGMFFNSANVVEEYEYDDAYCVLYNDPDAGMYNVEICVDLETYQRILLLQKSGSELIGSLVLNDDYSYDNMEVYTFMEEPEFEMAEASANH